MAVTRKKKNTKSKGAIKEEGKSLNGKSGAQKDHSKLNIKGAQIPGKPSKPNNAIYGIGNDLPIITKGPPKEADGSKVKLFNMEFKARAKKSL